MRPLLLPVLRALRPPVRRHSVYERLLGTEVELQVIAQTAAHAAQAETAGLDELDRLATVFSRFDEASEWRRWLSRPGERRVLSPDLREVLRQAELWRRLSGGAFHPGADALGALWKAAAARGELPAPADIAALVTALQADPWTLHEDGSATLHARYAMGLDALAKGVIVDRMAEVMAAQSGVRSVLVNVGGDLRTIGGRGLTVTVADPRTQRDDAPPVARVRVRNGALASSGQAHRGYVIRGVRYSHVLDPRTGQPVTATTGVTVRAPCCAAADALATILSVLPAAQGFTLLGAQPGCSALLVTARGELTLSPGWLPLPRPPLSPPPRRHP